LPPHIDPAAIKDFDYRRVYASGHLRHDQEMLIGPRMHDGNNGYLVITPLEREGSGTTAGQVIVEGLLREPWKKNMFTPDNKPEQGEYYFPDVHQMAMVTGSQPVWIEETMGNDLITEIWPN